MWSIGADSNDLSTVGRVFASIDQRLQQSAAARNQNDESGGAVLRRPAQAQIGDGLGHEVRDRLRPGRSHDA